MQLPDLSKIVLTTSSEIKRREFARFGPKGLAIESGDDLPEIMSIPDDIIVHKAIAAGENKLVEDTILVVDGEPWVDIKFRKHELEKGHVPDGTPLVWEVRLGFVQDGKVYSYLGQISGQSCKFTIPGGGFDPYFFITEQAKSLAQLEVEGIKDAYSSRRIALEKLTLAQPYSVLERSSIQKWEGAWQNQS